MAQGLFLRPLGPSGLKISAIGLGCWQFSRGQGLTGRYWSYLEQDEIDEIVRLSYQGGINWFDTAEAYGRGESERALAKALKKAGYRPGQVIIATKWRPVFRWASSIPRTIDTRLKNLDGFRIDLYQVHNPLSFSRVTTEMKAMAELVKLKKIGHVGVSNFSADQMRHAARTLEAEGLRLASNQVRYSLLDRNIERNGVLEAARDLGVTVIAYSPLAQGILTGKFHADPERIKRSPGYRKYMAAFKKKGLEKSWPVVQAVQALAAKHQATPAQVALSWVIHNQGPEVVAIPGASSPDQARDNTGALKLELAAEELEALSEASSAFLPR